MNFINDPKSKKFETTTAIKFSETYGEEEITLVDENDEKRKSLNSIKKGQEGDSITAKITHKPKKEKKEISVVTRRLQQILTRSDTNPTGQMFIQFINKMATTILSALNQCISPFEKRISARLAPKPMFVPVQKQAPYHRSVDSVKTTPFLKNDLSSKKIPLFKQGGQWFFQNKWWLIASAGLIVLIIIIVSVETSQTNSTKNGLPSVYNDNALDTTHLKNLTLSPISFHNPTGQEIPPLGLKAPSVSELWFFVDQWNAKENTKLELAFDVRLYADNGDLVLYKPHYTMFSGLADPTTEKIIVKTRFSLLKGFKPAGIYRIVLSATELSTQRKGETQAKIGVTP